MTEDLDFARFRQQFHTRPQRQLLGINVDQPTALRILDDENRLRGEYLAWRRRRGLPHEPAALTEEVVTITNQDVPQRRWNIWGRLTRQ